MKDRPLLLRFSAYCIAAVLILGLVHQCRRADRLENTLLRTDQDSGLDRQRAHQQILHWRDKAGQAHAERQAAQLDFNDLAHFAGDEMRRLRAETEHWKHLSQAVSTVTVTQYDTTFQVRDSLVYVGLDSMRVRLFTLKDRWMDLYGQLAGDSVQVAYILKNPVRLYSYWKREHWYRQRTLYVEMVAENPHTDISSLEPLVVRPEKKRWWQTRAFAFGLGAVIGFTGSAASRHPP